MNKSYFIVMSIIGLLVFPMQTQAGIYKCVDPQGVTVYLDKPCPVEDKETEMRAVKDPENGYKPPLTMVQEPLRKDSNVQIFANTTNITELNKKKLTSETGQVSLGASGSSEDTKINAEKAKSNPEKSVASYNGNNLSNNSDPASDNANSFAEKDVNVDALLNPNKYTTH